MKNNINESEIHLEAKLLIYCARTLIDRKLADKILSVVSEDLDWNYLLQMSSRHGLTPLLYRNLNNICPEMVPVNILRKLEEYFNANVQKNLFMTGELIRILELLNANDIDSIPYKGPVLANLAYATISLREFNDLDIFVKKSDTYEVYNLMISLGYELDSYPKEMDISLYFKTQSEHKFLNKKSKMIVEIHNKFEGHFFSFPISPEFLYTKNSLKTVGLNNYQISVLSNENLILMLCIHCARHDWSRLLWLCDISEMFKSHEIKCSNLFENAEKLKVKRILLINLFLARDLFGLELSDEVINHFKNNPNIENICFNLKKNLLSKNSRTPNILERTLLDLKKRESLKMGLIDVFSSMLRPTYADFKEITLPVSFYPLYYIIRPFLLLKRYGKDSI